jgi:hypothetical protein
MSYARPFTRLWHFLATAVLGFGLALAAFLALTPGHAPLRYAPPPSQAVGTK